MMVAIVKIAASLAGSANVIKVSGVDLTIAQLFWAATALLALALRASTSVNSVSDGPA